jgi:hypothetical protein
MTQSTGWIAFATLLVATLLGDARAQGHDPLPVFDIHFVVITMNPDAHRVGSVDQLRREVDILNARFITDGGKPLVTFRFKSAVAYQQARDSACDFAKLGDQRHALDTELATRRFNACDDARIRDPHAINFYVYDAYSAAAGFNDTTGHGRRNSDRPFLLLDWQRLNHNGQAPEEHEMGHAFGLGHVCAPGATRGTSTNIMASADCGRGSGGMRDLGFTGEQAATILKNAGRIAQRLRPSRR